MPVHSGWDNSWKSKSKHVTNFQLFFFRPPLEPATRFTAMKCVLSSLDEVWVMVRQEQTFRLSGGPTLLWWSAVQATGKTQPLEAWSLLLWHLATLLRKRGRQKLRLDLETSWTMQKIFILWSTNVSNWRRIVALVWVSIWLFVSFKLCFLGLEASKYDCGWCGAGTRRCTHSDSCTNTTPGAWLSQSQRNAQAICPFPRIDKFTPSKGPLNGGTKITITGINLGLTAADVRNTVHVANVQCDTVDMEYVSSTKVVCNSRAPAVLRKQTQHVVIKLKDDPQFTAISNDTFTYVNPSVISFQPFRGPRSGYIQN